MMAAECQINQGDEESRIAEYQTKFPEIPEAVLAKILQEHGNDPVSCRTILESESKKCLYGSSPTPDVSLSVNDSPGVERKSTSPGTILGTPTDLIVRSNSCGSSGSGQSSGRSTPIIQIPTPWVVQNLNQQSGNQYHGTTGIRPNMVYANGGYFFPATQDPGHHVSPSGLPANQTYPNSGYPVTTSGYFETSTGNVTTPVTNDRPPPYTPLPSSEQGTRPTHYSTMSGQPFHPGYMYYNPVNAGNQQLYQTSPGNIPLHYGHGGVFVPSRQTTPTTSGFIPVYPFANLTGQDHLMSRPGSGHSSPYTVDMNSPHMNPRFSTSLSGAVHEQHYQQSSRMTGPQSKSPYPTSTGFTPINPLPTLKREGPEKSAFSAGTSSENLSTHDEYITACLSQQNKRFQNLVKEYNVEKERLEIIIKEISDRDHDLYNRRHRVARDPTDEDVRRLTEEVILLNKVIEEISKNIDRLDNGQGILPPVNPVVNPPHRIVNPKPNPKPNPRPNQRVPEYDRSKSVPCPQAKHDQGQGKPQLSRFYSEHNPLQMDLGNNTVQYRLTPPSDSSLEDWNLVDQTPPNTQNQREDDDVHNDEGIPWSCVRCTFINHGSLRTCEMCNTER